MATRTIITTISDAWGHTLALYREADMYVVGTISSQQHLIPLGTARYATYGEAHDRLEQEQRQRRASLTAQFPTT